MKIRLLYVYGYRGQWDWEWNKSILNPSWEAIETAIRRLDANEFAGMGFALEEVYEDGGAQPLLHITGGQAQYLIEYSGGGGSSVRCVDPHRTEQQELVGVVRRDQGVWVPAKWICTDLELVITIAQYVTETGRPCPDVVWG